MEKAFYLDESDSTRHTAEYFGYEEAEMFGCRHSPIGAPRGGVVVCSSIQSEFVKNVRREVLLGRALATQGFAVQRFHYRGTGNSFGDEKATTFETMCDDAQVAASWLIDATGVDKIAFVGTRLGALIAAGAATRFDRAPLALWDPVSDGTQYFRELFRFIKMQQMVKESPTRYSGEPTDLQLKEKGRLDVFGYAIPAALYESLQGKTLRTELGEKSRSVLLVQFGDKGALRPEYARLLGTDPSHFDIETRFLLKRQVWWFSLGWEQDDPDSDELIKTTCSWINHRITTGAHHGNTPARPTH